MISGVVALDGYEDLFNFEAYYDLEKQGWCGHIVPYFGMKEATRIAELIHQNELEGEIYYDWETDTFTYTQHGCPAEEYHGVNIDGMHLYPIGANSWAWNEVKQCN